MYSLSSSVAGISAPISGAGRSTRKAYNLSGGTSRHRRTIIVRASDDEDMVPIVSGRRKRGFTKKEYEQVCW